MVLLPTKNPYLMSYRKFGSDTFHAKYYIYENDQQDATV
jgi:hypothetical protein